MRFSFPDVKVRFFMRMVIGLTVVVLISLFACTDSRQPDMRKGASEAMAPDFHLKDLTGREFTLSNLKGKPVLLIFITTWCPTCRSEMPHYKNIYETYGQQGLEVVSIDIQESKTRVSQFAEKNRVSYRMLLDENGDVAGAYEVRGIPAMVLVGKDGTIISKQYGVVDTLLETLFAKK